MIGAAQSQIINRAADKRLLGQEWAYVECCPPPLAVPTDALLPSWVTPWWPGCGGGMMNDGGFSDVAYAVEWGQSYPVSGCNGRLGFVGVTRDAYGSPLGGCTVRCFVTSTNELVSQVTSDANGYYIATSPYAVAHYLVVHKTLAPDVAGASVDTLVPG